MGKWKTYRIHLSDNDGIEKNQAIIQQHIYIHTQGSETICVYEMYVHSSTGKNYIMICMEQRSKLPINLLYGCFILVR